MCGRFTVATPIEELARDLGVEPPAEPFPLRYNVAPTQLVPAIVSDAPGRLSLLRWGLVPSWAEAPSIGGRLINARAESLATKPSFRKAFARRRCLVVADGFFEWRKEGSRRLPLWFVAPGPAPDRPPGEPAPRDRQPLTFAGLWEVWRAPDGTWQRTCTIVTVPANSLVAPVHDRMPAILPPEHRAAWLSAPPEEARELLVPFPAEELEARPVSPRVNSAACDDAGCIAPLPRPLTLPLEPR